jgi:hypothetical protein
MSMEHWWNGTDRGKLTYCEKKCPSATLCTANPKRTHLVSNLVLRGKRRATDSQSHGTTPNVPKSGRNCIVKRFFEWKGMTSLYLPQAVVVEGVVTGVGQMDTKSCTHRIEYLDSSIHPHLQNRSVSCHLTSHDGRLLKKVPSRTGMSLWPCQNSHCSTRVTVTVVLHFVVSWRH